MRLWAAWTAVFHRLERLPLCSHASVVPVGVELMVCDDAKSTIWSVITVSVWDGFDFSPFLVTFSSNCLGAVTYKVCGC